MRIGTLRRKRRTEMVFLVASLLAFCLGEGFIDVWRQMDPDHYDRIGRVATPADSRTGLFVPDLEELFETTPHHGAQGAQIGVYGTQ